MDLLPLDTVLGLLLYQSNSLQHISDVINTSFLPHCQGVCSLNDRIKAMTNTTEITAIPFSRLIVNSIYKEGLLYLCQQDLQKS